ncbi:hypothetical protein IQ268_29805 [Oculatella sp. LEGE 06141]|uniref:hypothetical protein n=1 Tax=Oculatella sp. LEGE 06141 TaxID=1828648 RepID=UPI0018829951|nr:hypothetical protein [Oculatella sp. LEGE 06141]MBE9182735.1 hypothetical protein [Oculatella sp. LEGE 06141]
MPRIADDDQVSKPRLPLQVLNVGAVVLAVVILVGYLLYLILLAFSQSGETGVRSLAATALPLITVTYITFFTRLFRLPDRVPVFNFYFVFTVWMIILLILVEYYFSPTIPLGEFAISFTLGLLVSIGRGTSFRAFISCAYGIISGFLLYIFFFGVPLN